MPPKPRGVGSQNEPSGLYNGMVAPLTKYSIRGILWNQGENNAGPKAFRYRALFTAMIEDWRQAWGEGDIPFLFVQLSRYASSGYYPLLRESQAEALHLAKTGMVVSVDVGMAKDVHYPDKATLGDRMFRVAERVAYGKDVAASGPRLRELTAQGSTLRLWFDGTDGGLAFKTPPVPEWGTLTAETKPADTADGKAIVYVPPTAQQVANAFQIAGSDGRFYPATVRVSSSVDIKDGGDWLSVLLSSESVPAPAQVCYAWQDTAPAVVLWNGAGFPASPFRASLVPGELPACPDGGKPAPK
jgi:sialate O-acetylesterase